MARVPEFDMPEYQTRSPNQPAPPGRRSVRKTLIAGLAVFALVAAACGADDDGATPTPDTQVEATPGAPAEGEQPTPEGTPDDTTGEQPAEGEQPGEGGLGGQDLVPQQFQNIARWTPEQAGTIQVTADVQAPEVDQNQLLDIFPGQMVSDVWPLLDRDGNIAQVDGWYVMLALTAPEGAAGQTERGIQPGAFGAQGSLRYAVSQDGSQWVDGGPVAQGGGTTFEAQASGGSAVYDTQTGMITIFFAAADQAGAPGTGEQPAPGAESPAPGVGEQSPAPGVGEQSPAPGVGEQSPAPGVGEQSPAPGVGEQSPAPGVGEQPGTGTAGDTQVSRIVMVQAQVQANGQGLQFGNWGQPQVILEADGQWYLATGTGAGTGQQPGAETPAPGAGEQTPAPGAEQTPGVGEQSPAPGAETPAPGAGEQTPAPGAEQTPGAGEQTPAPGAEQTPAVGETPAPGAEQTPGVGEQTPAPGTDPSVGADQDGFQGLRDPWYFRDPADGTDYLIFSARLAETTCETDGAVGLARATGDDLTSWQLEQPILIAPCVNRELERPHVIERDGQYYLFFTTTQDAFDQELTGTATPGTGEQPAPGAEQTPGVGEQTPGVGEQTPAPGAEQTPGVGEQTPAPGAEQTPGVGEQTPAPGVGEQTPAPGVGEQTPAPGMGEQTPAPGVGEQPGTGMGEFVDGLYGFVADSIQGDYRPLNESGLVLASGTAEQTTGVGEQTPGVGEQTPAPGAEQTPGVGEQSPAPGAEQTPGVGEQSQAPGVGEQSPAPGVGEQTPAPGVGEQTPAPGAEQTPGVGEQTPAPGLGEQPGQDQGQGQSFGWRVLANGWVISLVEVQGFGTEPMPPGTESPAPGLGEQSPAPGVGEQSPAPGLGEEPEFGAPGPGFGDPQVGQTGPAYLIEFDGDRTRIADQTYDYGQVFQAR
jgi:hypothetical protein